MADCATNKPIADAFIATLYPEVADIVALMDSLAAVGRVVYVLTLDDPDHGSVMEAKLTLDLNDNGYTASHSGSVITVACSS
jgi:hypothetical protein